MSGPRKTAIVTGASQGIGVGIVNVCVEGGFNVVVNSRKLTQSPRSRLPTASRWWTAISATRQLPRSSRLRRIMQI